MQTPKRKTSRSVRNQRRSHHALKARHSGSCPNCKAAVRPHHVCLACGYYRDRKLLSVEAAAE